MKKIFNMLMIIFAMAISLLIEPTSFDTQAYDIDAYIQSPSKEEVVLVSNNVMSGEVRSTQEEDSPTFLGHSPFVLSFSSDLLFLSKNKTHLNGCFIHNLSTNSKKVQSIRAP